MKKPLLNYVLPLVALLFLVSFTYAQTPSNSFQIVDNGNAENVSEYQIAIQQASFDNYRLRDERVTLTFDNGLKFQLFSANELVSLGINVNPLEYRESNDSNYQPPVLTLGPNGMIGAQYSTNPNRKN